VNDSEFSQDVSPGRPHRHFDVQKFEVFDDVFDIDRYTI
jgi:hypothetical protein